MYFPSLGQMVIATPHWLGSSLRLWADSQSPRQFSPQLSPRQLPVFHLFHPKLSKAVIFVPLLIYFSNGVQIVDDCRRKKKISTKHHSLTSLPPEVSFGQEGYETRQSAYIPYEYSLSHFCLWNYLIAEKQTVNYWWLCFLQWPE